MCVCVCVYPSDALFVLYWQNLRQRLRRKIKKSKRILELTGVAQSV
jgi:hypothetical protein